MSLEYRLARDGNDFSSMGGQESCGSKHSGGESRGDLSNGVRHREGSKKLGGGIKTRDRLEGRLIHELFR